MQNLEQLKTELDKVNALITKWIAQGYTPSIERGVALSTLEKIYEGMADFQSLISSVSPQGELEPEIEVELILADDTDTEEDTCDSACANEETQTGAPMECEAEVYVVLGSELSLDQMAKFSEELFGGDMSNFKAQVEKFAQMPSFEDALIYVGENFSWSPSSQTVGEFVEMLENYFQTK